MNANLKLENEQDHICRTIIQIDPRLTISTAKMEEWRKEIGVEDLAALICLPGFPAPTADTAHLPLEQRKWPFAAVAHQMLLRTDGIEVCEPGGKEGTHEIPCLMHIKLSKVD